MRSTLWTFLAVGCWWATGSLATAAIDRWKTAASGTWSVGSNWEDGSAPGASEQAQFLFPGNYVVTLIADPSPISTLRLDDGDVTFTSSSFLTPSTLRVQAPISDSVKVNGSTALTFGSAGGIFQPDRPLHFISEGIDMNGGGAERQVWKRS